MGTCVVCGNHYENTFTVTTRERSGEYDSFECAIHDLAPPCSHCGCRIIGHGVGRHGRVFCCEHCATHEKGDA